MQRLRLWLRAWLCMDVDVRQCLHNANMQDQIIDVLEQRILSLESQMTEFKQALKAKAAVRAVPRYSDFETASVDALKEFEEKPNGISR